MSQVMSEDASDLAAARRGGPEGHAAFARIYDRHAAVVLAMCRGHVPGRSVAEAEDALQEVFIRAYRKLDSVEDAGCLRSWLLSIARFVCAERRRAAGRRSRHEEAAAMNETLRKRAESDGHAAAGTADAAEHSEQLERLSRALDALPERERLAIHMYYLDPDPVAAAGEALGMSRSGFYKLLNRAKEQLAGLMAEANPS